MNESSRANVWKLTAIGVVVAVASALVTGLVVANRASAPTQDARVEAPSAAPTAVVTPPAATPPAAVAQAPATPPAAAEATNPGVPTREAINACNRHAANQAGSAPKEGKDKYIDIAKDAGIGAVGGAAVGALGGAAVKGGKGAGKGALLGGALGAGGGTLYGIWDNKKDDERYRAAYGSCMKSRGYTG
ncbi:MAG: hypothetical protein DMD78_20790 [Candidatus Rokuibacteriota bacterium]|nr:MAG: hypothetical protein DMD78_20790 [Candidatus Rokubacteria bacterium]